MLPTLASLAGANLPANPIDGRNVWDLITDKPGAKNPHDYYPFCTGRIFEGVLSGDGHWKLHIPHNYQTLDYAGHDGEPGKYKTKRIELSLFDMENDPYETRNVIDSHPDIAKKLRAYAEEHRREFFPDQPTE